MPSKPMLPMMAKAMPKPFVAMAEQDIASAPSTPSPSPPPEALEALPALLLPPEIAASAGEPMPAKKTIRARTKHDHSEFNRASASLTG